MTGATGATGAAGGGDLSAADEGFLGWTYSPNVAGVTEDVWGNTGKQGMNLCKCVLSGSCTGVTTYIAHPATDATTDQNYLALYEPTYTDGAVTGFTLLAVTAAGDMDTQFVAGGVVNADWVTPVDIVAGNLYYVASLQNTGGATAEFQIATGITTGDGQLPSPPSCAIAGPNTTPPGSGTPSQTTVAGPAWFALVGA